MNTIERALQVLIHDIRTPVGVAHGYLRLLREDRLKTPEDRARALTHAQQALDVVSRLCADAAALADPPAAVPRAVVSCQRLVERVRERLEREPVDVTAETPATDHRVTVPADTDALVDAISRVLLVAPPDSAAERRAVAAGTTDTELWFRSGRVHQTLSGDELDPWRGPGFSLLLAVRTIADGGGRVWAAGAGRVGTGVAFPLEVTR